MSIAEKLTTIAENTPKVYDKGKQDEYNTFWDSIYEKIERDRSTYHLFSGSAWNDTNFKPPRDIVLTQDARGLFRFNGIRNLKACLDDRGVKLDFSNVKHVTYIFEEAAFERVGVIDVSAIPYDNVGGEGFNRCPNLISVEKFKWGDNYKLTGRFATNTTNLESITFEGVFRQNISFDTNPKLNDTTIQNIIDCLADLTGDEAQTLTVHSNVYQKIIDNGWDALITAKNWILVSA